MVVVNAMGDACPIPIVKTKKAIAQMNGAGVVETLVDNEIAVQNLTKMANVKGYEVKAEQLGTKEYKVTMTVGENAAADVEDTTEYEACEIPVPRKKNVVVQISADHMGEGAEKLGRNLLKGFIYALSQLDELPTTILFYNGGASIPCEGSESLEDLKSMAEDGVEILTCGTCLDFYGLKEKLAVGEVTNMYVIVEKLTGADKIIRP